MHKPGESFPQRANPSAHTIDLDDLKGRAGAIIDAQMNSGAIGEKLENRTLSADQIKRAEGLGFTEERIAALERVMVLSSKTLGKMMSLDAPFKNAMKYLNDIVISIVSRAPFDTSQIIPKEEIRLLCEAIFTEENIQFGIPYIMAYFLPQMGGALENQIINVRLLTGLVHFWHTIGTEHPLYGQVPREWSKETEVFECYTAHKEDGRWYFTLPVINKNGTIESDDYNIDDPTVIPDTFGKLGMHSGDQTDIDLDIGHYETIYVLGGSIYKYLGVATKGLHGFIKRHAGFLSEEGNAPWSHLRTGEEHAWQGAKKILLQQTSKLDSPGTQPKDSPRGKGRAARRLPPPPSKSAPSPNPTQGVVRVKGGEIPDLPRPVVLSGLAYKIQTGTLGEQSPITNWTDDKTLWIGVELSRGEIQWTRHNQGGSFSFSTPSEKTRYTFVFSENTYSGSTPPEGRHYPMAQIDVSPVREVVPPNKTPPDSKNMTIVDVQAKVATLVDAPSAKDSHEGPKDKTIDVGIEILDILENHPSRITVSGSDISSSSILGVFETDPVVTFEIEEGDVVTFGPADIVGVNLSELKNELKASLKDIMRLATHLRNKAFLKEYEQSKKRLSIFLSHLTVGSEKIDIGELLEDSQIYDTKGSRYGGDIFTSRLHNGKFDAIKEIFGREGIDINLVESRGNTGRNYSLELKVTGTTVYKVFFQKESPYYMISHSGPKYPEEIDTFMRGLVLDLYVSLSLLGKKIYEARMIQPGDTTTHHQGYSEGKIKAILNGTYQHPEGERVPLTEARKALIAEAAERVKRGELKVSEGQNIDLSTGVLISRIRTARGLSAFYQLDSQAEVVLVDEKFVCINNEQAAKTKAKWKSRPGKHPYSSTYALLRGHERSQKYMIRRMIATIRNGNYRGLSPLENSMGRFFMTFWGRIDRETQEAFVSAVTRKDGGAGKGLKVKLRDGTGLFATFIKEADEAEIPLIYSKPNTLPKSEVIEYINSDDYRKWLQAMEQGPNEVVSLIGK